MPAGISISSPVGWCSVLVSLTNLPGWPGWDQALRLRYALYLALVVSLASLNIP